MARGKQAPLPLRAEGCQALISDDATTATIADVRVRESSAIVRLRGEIDVANHDELRAALRAARATTTELIIELTDLAFIDWTATAIVLSAVNDVRARGGRVTLVEPRPQVRRLFFLMGLDGPLSA